MSKASWPRILSLAMVLSASTSTLATPTTAGEKRKFLFDVECRFERLIFTGKGKEEPQTELCQAVGDFLLLVEPGREDAPPEIPPDATLWIACGSRVLYDHPVRVSETQMGDALLVTESRPPYTLRIPKSGVKTSPKIFTSAAFLDLGYGEMRGGCKVEVMETRRSTPGCWPAYFPAQ